MTEIQRRENTGVKRKILIWAAAIALLLLGIFRDPQTIMQNETTRIYQVYCIGDSITRGNGLDDTEREIYSYPAVLESLLGAHYKVYNYGFSGNTLINVSKKYYRNSGYIDEVKVQNPDILLVMLGTNDSKKRNWDAKAYKAEYLALVTEFQTIGGDPEIYLMIPPEAFPGEDGEIIYGIDNDVIYREIGSIVKEVAKETNVHVIDLYAVTENHPEYFGDGVHPNREGYAILAQAIYEQMVVKE